MRFQSCPTARGGLVIKHVLITGANKGIGLATVRAILDDRDDIAVLLGARNASLGNAAIESLCKEHPDWAERLQLLQIDVADDQSVTDARDQLLARSQDSTPLYGLVNNAGIGLGSVDNATVLNVNTLGVKRVCDAFLPLIEDGGRIVNVSSASGPNFVSQCSDERQAFFKEETIEWPAIQELIDRVLTLNGEPEACRALGLGDISAYGLSKACVSLYTVMLARENPQLVINACTPGYIETDLTRPAAKARGATPEDLGMKPPSQGTISPMFLLFGQPQGSGHYYGSDAKRSPLDRYRAPGDPEFCP